MKPTLLLNAAYGELLLKQGLPTGLLVNAKGLDVLNLFHEDRVTCGWMWHEQGRPGSAFIPAVIAS